jgi:hypothetical protein
MNKHINKIVKDAKLMAPHWKENMENTPKKRIKDLLVLDTLRIAEERKKTLAAVSDEIHELEKMVEEKKAYDPKINMEDKHRISLWFWEGVSSAPGDNMQVLPAWADGDTLYSYGTQIAKIDGTTVYLNKKSYSSITGKIQKYIAYHVLFCQQHGDSAQLHLVPQSFFETNMPKKFHPKWKARQVAQQNLKEKKRKGKKEGA